MRCAGFRFSCGRPPPRCSSGWTTLAVELNGGLPVSGATFVAALATYTGARQLLFPFRADPHTRRGRNVTLAVCVALLAADVAVVAAAVWLT